MAIRIAPSILSADFANLETDIRRVARADWLHVDVMDGHFVPNMTLGLPVVKRIAEVSPLPVDAHLMIEDPEKWAPRYAEAGAKSVTFHAEAALNPVTVARDIRSAGARAALALKSGHARRAVPRHPVRVRHGADYDRGARLWGSGADARHAPEVRQVAYGRA